MSIKKMSTRYNQICLRPTDFGQSEKSTFLSVFGPTIFPVLFVKSTTWEWKMAHIIRDLDLNFNHKQ